MAKILVTPRSLTSGGDPALALLKEHGHELVFSPSGVQPTERQLLELLPGCVGYLAGVETISARVIDAAGDLKVISRNGTGVDAIDLAACARRGIRVLRAEGANARGVAELTIGLLLDLARRISLSDAVVESGGWKRYKGFEVEGKVLGIVGCGKVGKLVAQLAIGMGMRVVGFDPYPDRDFHPGPSFRFALLEELFRESHAVTLHCPPLPEGRPLIDAGAIGMMRPGALLINAARAELVDEQTVLDALDAGRLGGFATDVHRVEPPGKSELIAREGVLATPHIGGYTGQSVERATRVAVDNLLAALAEAGA